jgi:soluble lytic murein transglycosylase-like protein
MSYSMVLARIESLEARLGIWKSTIARTPSADSGQFDEVLQKVRNGFASTPELLASQPGESEPLPTGTAAALARRGRAMSANETGLSPEIRSMFTRSAQSHSVPLELVMAVAKAESGFRPDAVSPAGARGIMQLMPATGAGLGVRDFFDPAQNIEGGTRYLRNALRIFDNDVVKAVASYNAGVGAVQQHGGVPPYSETRNYVRKVLQYAREYGMNV